jgi:hypothetical protein
MKEFNEFLKNSDLPLPGTKLQTHIETNYDIVLSEYVFNKDGLHATIDLNDGKVTIRTDIEQIRRYYWEGKEV